MSRLVVLVWRIFLLKTMKYFRLNYFCIITFIFLGNISITNIYYCFVIIFFKSVKPCKQSTHFKQLTILRFLLMDFLKFFCQNFATFEDFSKPMVLRNVEKSSNKGKFRKKNEEYIVLKLFHTSFCFFTILTSCLTGSAIADFLLNRKSILKSGEKSATNYYSTEIRGLCLMKCSSKML